MFTEKKNEVDRKISLLLKIETKTDMKIPASQIYSSCFNYSV